MGWLGIFGGDPEKKREKQIAKAASVVKNPHSQPQERSRYIEVLAGIGTMSAVTALLGRFTMRTPGAIVDEDEKRMVFDALVALGPICVAPIQEFIGREPHIYWPLRALTEIAGDDVAVETILQALEDTEEGFGSDNERREQLASNLREYNRHDKAYEKLVELASDESVDVRTLAIDGLPEFDRPDMVEVLVGRLEDEEETQRIKVTVMDILMARGVSVKNHRERVTPHLGDLFFIDGNGVIQRKGA